MKKVLLVSNSSDVHSDFLVQASTNKNVQCFRYNTDHIRVRGNLTSFSDGETTIHIDGRQIALSDIDLLIYRRPIDVRASMLQDSIDTWILSYVNQEWSFVESSFPYLVRGKVINRPAASFSARNKWIQLKVAQDCGLSVPDSLIANDLTTLRDYLDKNKCITKAIGTGTNIEKETVRTGATMRATVNMLQDDYKSFTVMLLQKEIPPKAMWRIVTVGERSIGFRMTGEKLSTHTDSRLVEEDLDGVIAPIPTEIHSQMQRMMKKFGIIYSSSDFIEDKDGKLWFIDLNPDGQWGAYEHRFKAPISEMIIEEAL